MPSTWSLVLLLSIAAWQIANVAARYHHIKFRHARHRRQHADGYLPSSFVSDTDEPEDGLWGPWSAPSSCSRSCGGGVAHQTRRCLDIDDNGYDRCQGAKRRFFSCNIQPCPSGAGDFRAVQCAEFNNVPFEDVLYDWIPYTGGPNKCELNCMPRGERFFYRHKLTVIDGTPCDVEKNDVCVEGRCMPVGCDMMLGSDAREDACRECGGDGSDCNTVSGLFDDDALQFGYVDILLIPEGATNIVIKERAPSNNYLAIRNVTGHYYLNGNWRIDFPRSLMFAGTIFHYARDPQGFSAPDTITALGPTTEAIYVVLLYQDTNVGVQYEYSIPQKFSHKGDPDSYTWTADEFSECSVSCGGGYQSRRVSCVKRRDNEPVDENLCDRQLEPDDTQSCNEEACPPEWVEGEWGPCSKHCGEGGERSRDIKCEQIIAGGIPTIVDDTMCLERVGQKNETTQECNRDVECPKWHLGPWKPCDHLCGAGKQIRRVACYTKNEAGKIEILEDSACEGDVPEKEKPCELRPCAGLDWVTSDWSGCDDKCGLTQETRTAHCATQDGTVYPDDKCDLDKKPELTRQCENTKGCEYEWYTAQWSKCSAKCGKGVQTRKVFCAIFEDELTLKRVADEKCASEQRYNDTKECTAEVGECKGEWFAGPWSKCSKACGGGDMTRKVICMKDGMSVPTSNCDVDSIMFGSEECNKHPCGDDQVMPVTPGQSVPTDEEECEEYEDEAFVTLTSKFGTSEGRETEATSDLDRGFTLTSFDTMMSDSTFTRGDFSPTDEDTGFSSSGYGSGEDEFTIFSSIYTDSTFAGGEYSTFEGSGTSPDGKSTDFDEDSSITTEISGSTDVSTTLMESESTSDASAIPQSTEASTDASSASQETAATEATQTSLESSSEATTQSSDSSSGSSEPVSESSTQTEESSTAGSTEFSTQFSTDGTTVSSSDSSESSTSESQTGASSTESSSESSDTASTVSAASEITEASQTTDSAATDSTESTPTTSSEETPTTSSEETPTTSSADTPTTSSDETPTTSSEQVSTTSSDLSTTSSDATTTPASTMSTVEGSTTTEKLPFTVVEVDGEVRDHQESDNSVSSVTTIGSSDSTTETLIGMSTTEVSSSSKSSDGSTTDSGLETTESTESSGSTAESASTVDFTTTTGSSESAETTLTGETTASGASTETGPTTESSATTESGSTESETTGSSEISESGMTTVTESGTTETQTDVSTASGTTATDGTTETGITEQSLASRFTDEEEETDLTEKSSILDLFTTVSPIEAAITKEHKLRKCKIRKKKSCRMTEFNCCYDGITPAKGPFGKGCPTPQTCAETEFGCCPDGVSVATGPKNENCPSQHCAETLFGCCQDGVTPAEGNDFEGCKKPCNETEFGCCPDKETPAAGADNLGCCNVTKFGCCPDGIKAATGPDEEGCVEVVTEETEWTELTSEYETTTPAIEEDCNNSTYGCCPDGSQPATGRNFDGCDVINTENCTMSYFGCCTDGVTAALGPNAEGCHAACESSDYGCCPDNTTPAHGPNGEGCCLTSPYGCCPDNILSARGPNFYGCGCEYSRFRCCPDNTTAARGPNNEGCGCQYTPHGCCPNRFTPATGPNFEGCPCYTYQFGCCHDGVTVAKGPHSQGCGCEATEFKCCSDNQTPAKGPNFAGCTCDASKYGCCPDGVEDAQGENFEGCRTIPSTPSAACSLPRDRGTCRDFTVNWFFDTEYGGCSRFWYGGCDGNDNRFKTQEECKDICVAPKGRDACLLPKSPGPCKGYNPTWYYDIERKQCGQFIYGGCLGNSNKFNSQKECEDLCVIDEDTDPCELPRESGPCEGNFTRWYFNKDNQACEQFLYGGCKANTNNFPTEVACHQQCLQPGHSRVTHEVCALERDPGPCPGSLLRWYYDARRRACRQFVYGGCKGNGNKFRTRAACEQHCPRRDSCSLPRAEGNCTEKYPRWYFDQSENRCMPFYFTGCSGNKNNYQSREACESDCPPKIEQDICLLPALLGECHNYTQRWYYDSYEQRCRQFYYGGCGGNHNNFGNEDECLSRCVPKEATTPPDTPQRFSPAHCFLPDERGPCNNNQTKWFYDSRDGVCKQFIYGGCASNGNKFESRQECEYHCGEIQDACQMPKVIGPCSGSVIQYFYDRRADTCEEFEYSGCDGNRNRFQDRESCETKCRRRPPPREPQVTQAPLPASEIVPSSPICSAPVDAGPCNNEITAYYYDPHTHACQAFIYGGCEGNANRFQSEEQCERLCGRFQGQDICNLSADVGPCRGTFKKYFYDPNARACREFFYGGCDGNANRFSTVPECESVCLHREEPAPAGNNTALSHLAICREPVDVGSCPTANYKRFYFDDERQTCMAFLYTGCGGNRNKFKTFESCMQMCFRTSNEIDVGKNASKDPCQEAKEECSQMHCPYGKEAYVDDQLCEHCRCVDPCRSINCPEGTRCAITLAGTSNEGTEYKAVCRSTTKDGRCPIVSNSTRCEQECNTDADCAGETKCCNNGCGTSCLEPASEQRATPAPVFNETAPQSGSEPAQILQPEQPRVSGEEGGYVNMKCIAIGNPRPRIVWKKDAVVITPAEKRRRILQDGTLEIINLYSYDRGTYICIADNGLAPPVKTEYQLEVMEPHDRSAAIVGEPNTFITVTMNSPTVLHCYAMGWPRPFVTWWHGDRMLPLSSEYYEQDSEYTLLIRSVTLTNLGIYTCQAYNGVERPASWSVTLQALGPVYNMRPEHQEYLKYLVQPPKPPNTGRPQYPYRPARTQAPEYNQTYAPLYTNAPYVPPVIPLTPQPPVKTVFKVPVNVSISVSGSEFPVGGEISMGCAVDGYPIPRVIWYKDNNSIRDDGRVTISESNRLVINNAGHNDTGKYRCEAYNEYSSAAAEVDIKVAGIYIHPDCQDNTFFANCDLIVTAKYCEHHYYAKFCCRSCTEAGQLPVRRQHPQNSSRRRRSIIPPLF